MSNWQEDYLFITEAAGPDLDGGINWRVFKGETIIDIWPNENEDGAMMIESIMAFNDPDKWEAAMAMLTGLADSHAVIAFANARGLHDDTLRRYMKAGFKIKQGGDYMHRKPKNIKD